MVYVAGRSTCHTQALTHQCPPCLVRRINHHGWSTRPALSCWYYVAQTCKGLRGVASSVFGPDQVTARHHLAPMSMVVCRDRVSILASAT